MCTARDKNDDHISSDYFLLAIEPAIEVTSKWVCVARDNIEDHIKNKCFLLSSY
jgi:hypothetical protein